MLGQDGRDNSPWRSIVDKIEGGVTAWLLMGNLGSALDLGQGSELFWARRPYLERGGGNYVLAPSGPVYH